MLSLETITKADLPRTTELYSRYLTAGRSLAEGTYDAWERGGCLGTKAVENGEIAGFFTLRPGMELTYPHPELEAELRKASQGRRLYTVDGMLVLPQYRGEGLSHRLVAATLPKLRAFADLVLIEIWIYPDGSSPGKKPQETLGEIIYRKKVPLFYRDLRRYHMRCPICGDPCKCGAWIELAQIEQGGSKQGKGDVQNG